MKRLLQTERKRNLKEAFKGNIVFRIINEAYKEQESKMETLRFSPEEIWVNCFYTFDQMLRSRDDIEDLIKNMWNDIYCDLRDEAKDNSREYKVEELEVATSCIVYSVIACMMATDDWEMVRHIESLMSQINSRSDLDEIRKPFDVNIEEDYVKYIQKYISSGKYISEILENPHKLSDPINQIESPADRLKAKEGVKKRLDFMKGALPDSEVMIMSQSNHNKMIEAVEYLIENNVVKKQDVKIPTHMSINDLRYTFYLVYKNEGKCIDRNLWISFLVETFSQMQNNKNSIAKHFSDKPSNYKRFTQLNKEK